MSTGPGDGAAAGPVATGAAEAGRAGQAAQDAAAEDAAGADSGRGELLPRAFFGRPSQQVAPDLLGCVLESGLPDGLVAVVLTEVEAYAGLADPASHAYRGPTRRNAVMFGEPGHAYVYFTYGMHFCVNLVCLPEGTASAVLLRAGAVVAGTELARSRRAATRSARADPPDRDLARGPARLCQALGIDRALDGADACDPGSVLRIRAGSRLTPPGSVRWGPRVGVSRAADEPWRFWIAGDPTVSAYRPYAPRRAKPAAGR
jgi:DNA-3-methyladenine glycosylase